MCMVTFCFSDATLELQQGGSELTRPGQKSVMLTPQHSLGGVQGPGPWDIVWDAIDDDTCQALHCP